MAVKGLIQIELVKERNDGASVAGQVSQPVSAGAGGLVQADRTNILNVKLKVVLLFTF